MRTAYVAVETASGPHVTPQAFAVAHGHVWLVAARDSLKVRALRRDPRVGVLFVDGDESVSVTGTAEVVSPLDTGRIALLASALPWASSDYAARNAPLMAGFVADILDGSAPLPLDRVLIAVTPGRTDRLSESIGRVEVEVEVDALPTRSELELPPSAVTAALAVSTSDGPVVMPARWDSSTEIASVATDHIDASDACLTLDQTRGVRPSRFRGVLLRGHVAPSSSGYRLAVERITAWHGFRSSTLRAA